MLTLDPESLEEDEDWNELPEGAALNVDAVVLNEHAADAFGIDGVAGDASDDRVELDVLFDKYAVLDHLLLDEQHLFSAANNEVTLGIYRTLLQHG